MADVKAPPPAGSEDAEVFLSASEDETAPQVITPELLSALVKQVEFYFSDANLPTDKKLLKQIRKDPDGFVPVKLFANFRKVRALSKDVSVITEALRSATLLQLSQDGKRVRRIVPVPEYDISDIQRRTIVVENLPGNPSPTIESVTEMFRVYGRVKLVRICSRESKGKLPSWLTSSCQHMGGQQHAYVEFEEEEGAILASAALASDNDAPDGVVQVRRLLACIAEQRERRSVTGAGSSFGGSSGGGSRKGSRDVSPISRQNAGGSRRGSGGGAQYASSAYSCGGSTWTSSSAGGAAPDPFHASFHAYRSYGGAFDHGGGSRSGSGGGAVPSPPLSFVPPPPPPPRRSCDSAPPSDLLPAAAAAAASAPPPPVSGRSLNVYRPPAKRLSDGYHCGFQQSNAAGHAAAGPSPLLRGLAASFGSSCGTASVASASAASTPTAAPSSPSPLSTGGFIHVVANSPPLATRVTSCGGASVGKPPVHPVAIPAPPPPPPPQSQRLQSVESPVALPPPPPAPQQHQLPHAQPTVMTSIAVPSSALAEAIAHVQAERRASEAGAVKVAVAAASVADTVHLTAAPAAAPVAASAAAAPVVTPRTTAPSAPKFCLDLGTGTQARGSRSNPHDATSAAHAAASDAATTAKPGPVATALPRGTQTQMVANVEDFINNILAGRPTARPAPAAPQQHGSAGGAQSQPQRKATCAPPATITAAPRAAAATPSQPQPAVDAATAVAGILATTLRRTVPVAPVAPILVAPPATLTPDVSAASCSPSTANPAAASAITTPEDRASAPAPATEKQAAVVAAGRPGQLPAMYLAVVPAGESEHADISLEHAVTVTVHHSPAPLPNGAATDFFKKTTMSPAVGLEGSAPVVAYVNSCSDGGMGSAGNSPPSSPMLVGAKGARATSGVKVTGVPIAVVANGNGPQTVRTGAGAQAGAKRLSRRDYAQWAAATPEFRAEAASKYAGSNASGSPNSTTGGFGVRSSGGGVGPGVSSPSAALAALSISDGGVFGTVVASGPAITNSSSGGGGHHHLSSGPGPIWHVAKGPDGSKGFAGRGRLLAA